MITRIQAFNYRCLRSVDQRLGSFQILVGPNGSGKSAFLDIIAFMAALAGGQNLEAVINERTTNFYDLIWRREGSSFDLAIRGRIPEARRVPPRGERGYPIIHWELTVRLDPVTERVGLAKEKVALLAEDSGPVEFLESREGITTLASEDGSSPQVVNAPSGMSALYQFLVDEARWPGSSWFRGLLGQRVQCVSLENKQLRNPSPPQQGKLAIVSGSNLARVVAQLEHRAQGLFNDWLSHIRTSLPDLETLRTVLRPEDKHRYLMLRYKNGVEVPSWVVSDGTLRLLALTVLAYLPDSEGIYVIEEPETGVHPSALETIYQSLSSVYQGQVLVASHSPILLSLAKPEQLLCFTKSAEGTSVVLGNEHPMLQDWKGEVNLSDLFAAGVLG